MFKKLFSLKIIAFLLLFLNIGIFGFVIYRFSGVFNTTNEDIPIDNSPINPTPTKIAQITETPAISLKDGVAKEFGHNVIIFLSKNPESNEKFDYLEAHNRITHRLDLAQFSIEQLIIGPTESEKQKGFFTPVKFTGDSKCGRDFNFNLIDNTAHIKFCRNIVSNGVGDDARVKAAIQTTINQFSDIRKLIILDVNDNCFGDQSGENICKK